MTFFKAKTSRGQLTKTRVVFKALSSAETSKERQRAAFQILIKQRPVSNGRGAVLMPGLSLTKAL